MHQPIPDTVIDAFMALAAEKPFESITLGDIATRAGLTLGALREVADGKLAILAAFIRRVDRAVLDEAAATETGDEPHRDRLFDIVMRRLDRLASHRPAIRLLAASARRDPALALALNGMAQVSARYMLAAAGIGTDGLRGLARVQGLVLLLGRLLPVWLDDTDPDQSRTMAALDRALSRAEDCERRISRAERALCRIVGPFRRRDHAHEPPPAQPPAPQAGEAAA